LLTLEKIFTVIPQEICLKPLILLAILNCMAQKSGSSHPIAQRNVKNAQFSRVFVEFLWDDCEKKIENIRLTSFRAPAIY